MTIINFSAVRRFFKLNVSSNELNIIEKNLTKKLVSVSNSTSLGLEKTLLTTGNAEKRERIQNIMGKLNNVRYGDVSSTHREEIKAETSELSGHQLTRNIPNDFEKKQRIDNRSPVESGNVVVNPPEACLTNKQAKILESFRLLGVNLTSWPNNYHELFSAIKTDLPESVSAAIDTKFSNIDKTKKLTPGVTQKIILKLLDFPACYANVALHFEGKLDVDWSQSEKVLSNIQIGKNGLCASLSFKWCGDKNQGVDFFNDINTEAGLEEVMSIKIFEDDISHYLAARELTLSDTTDKLEFQPESFHIVTIDPLSKGYGHAMAAMADDTKQIYKFFDPNYGEFSFSSSENMKEFIQKFTSMCYPTLKVMKNITFNHV